MKTLAKIFMLLGIVCFLSAVYFYYCSFTAENSDKFFTFNLIGDGCFVSTVLLLFGCAEASTF